jgi:hypothetical protein
MRLPACAILLLLAACSEPDFDERYDEAENEINAKAAELDAELETEDAPETANASDEM